MEVVNFPFKAVIGGDEKMRLINWLRKLKTIRVYKQNALLGLDVEFCEVGRCSNLSGKRDRIRIGDHSVIKGNMCVSKNGKITIGDHFYMGPNSWIGSEAEIQIGRCVIISNDVRIYDNNNHPTSPKAREHMSLHGFANDNWEWHHSASSPVIINDNVWIGQYSTILKGVTIGKGSIVATRAVVTKDVPPYAIVAGNPAKVVKWLETE